MVSGALRRETFVLQVGLRIGARENFRKIHTDQTRYTVDIVLHNLYYHSYNTKREEDYGIESLKHYSSSSIRVTRWPNRFLQLYLLKRTNTMTKQQDHEEAQHKLEKLTYTILNNSTWQIQMPLKYAQSLTFELIHIPTGISEYKIVPCSDDMTIGDFKASDAFEETRQELARAIAVGIIRAEDFIIAFNKAL